MIKIFLIDSAHIPLAGNFDPFGNENQSPTADSISTNESHGIVNLPSLELIHDHVHQSLEVNETTSNLNNTQLEKVGPSLDMIDLHDKKNSSFIENAKHFFMQPSIDFLDGQLHDGNEHIHNNKNQTDKSAADLNDFHRWLKEQNETNQLNRFLLLQKEINQFHFVDTKNLTDKLNRTIEEIKSIIKEKKQLKHEL